MVQCRRLGAASVILEVILDAEVILDVKVILDAEVDCFPEILWLAALPRSGCGGQARY